MYMTTCSNFYLLTMNEFPDSNVKSFKFEFHFIVCRFIFRGGKIVYKSY